MGRDKGRLAYFGEPQASRAWRMLESVCPRAFVSVRPEQAGAEPYSQLPYIVDDDTAKGPVAGVLAAWAQWEGVAWLLLAADMPFVDEAMLRELIRARDPTVLATAFRHRGGAPEPLCTIWEPRAHRAVLRRARARERSLRGLLEVAPVHWVDPPDASRLASVNTPEEYERVRAALGPSRAP